MIERLLGIIITIVAVVGGTVGAAVSEYPSLAFGGSFAGLALMGFWLMYRSLRRELRACEGKHSLSEWRFELLLGVLRREGIPVPDEVWGVNQ